MKFPLLARMKTGFAAALAALFMLPVLALAQTNPTTSAKPAAPANVGVAKAELQPPTANDSGVVRMPDGRLVAPEIARIIARGELIVAVMSRDTVPFVYEVNGKLVGVDIELAQQISDELKVPIRFDRSAKTYDEVVELVAMGRADLGVSKLARTLKRAKYVLFSDPYMRLEHSLLINRLAFASVARDQSVAQAVRNFNGKISVLAGSAWEEFARRNFIKATIVPYPTWATAVEAVKKGEVVAAYRDAIEVRTIMQSDPTLALTLRTVSFSDLESILCVMVGPRDFVLQSFVNEIIANQPEKLTVNGLLKRMK
ncbi:MAG: amino acid ABC transporter substrate-binding protein [Polaromonas sp.]|nr:MAG: amino acid ABC transporter substrate-binding protein [Polaromonas sp.]